MSEVLARIRVKEEHGIRRFLYPLTADVTLPEGLDTAPFSLTTSDGQSVPLQVMANGRIDFALSLAPYETLKLKLIAGGPLMAVPDPLVVSFPEADLMQSIQERFRLTLGPDALPREVIYDGVSHLRGPLRIEVNGRPLEISGSDTASDGGPLAAWASAIPTGNDAQGWVSTEVTACKSWLEVMYNRHLFDPGDTISFILPLAVTSPILTWDIGAGGGIYGKLQALTAEEVSWQTEISEAGAARWTVATDGRVDYTGEAATVEFSKQQWFHLIDVDKALAVAITCIDPDFCTAMAVTLRHSGDVKIDFVLGRCAVTPRVAAFDVCYHFLNDVPAIAAATNPQSILLPPTVEVLPA